MSDENKWHHEHERETEEENLEEQENTEDPAELEMTEQERLTQEYTDSNPIDRLKWMFTNPKTYFKGAAGHKGNKWAMPIIGIFLLVIAFGGCSALGTGFGGHSMQSAYNEAQTVLLENEQGIPENSYFVPLDEIQATKKGEDTYSMDIEVEPGDGYLYTYEVEIFYDSDGSMYWEYYGPY